MPASASYWIEQLNLQSHPEGGHFREVYRSREYIQKKGLPDRYSSFRSFSTSIYFLLKSNEFSAFHRLKSDEVWHFYQGSPLTLHVIGQNGKLLTVSLGPDLAANQLFQFTVPKGSWFAGRCEHVNSYSLLGCTVAPGFDFDDFEMANGEELSLRFPQHRQLIRAFTR